MTKRENKNLNTVNQRMRQFKKDLLTENKYKEKKILPKNINEENKKKFNAEIFSLDAFRSKKED